MYDLYPVTISENVLQYAIIKNESHTELTYCMRVIRDIVFDKWDWNSRVYLSYNI